ncbi:MAG: winged helix-turn-helix domain-containing protein [Chlorobi bacterium CHB2]|nr:winged helix-turn-helix domain-containing protein [Chlorobi bacterium CHB2]
MLNFTHDSARHLMLAAQGLDRRLPKTAGKHDVLKAIQRMQVLQIDTIHVVARSPYLVLWSRLGAYHPAWLDEHLAERRLFEYWAHEACFIPIEDYPLYRHRMVDPGSLGWKYSHAWMERHRPEVERVMEHIRSNGPARSVDFKASGTRGGTWWEWKPEKRALEMMFTAGELMIARRQNFQRVYDLRQRLLPNWDDSAMPSTNEVMEQFARKAVKALGVTTARWVADYFRTKKGETIPVVENLAERGELLRADVEGLPAKAFVHPDNLALAKQAIAGKLTPSHTTLLSPFDPLVWDRERALAMFGFDYRIECYTPAPKRKYGYFTLPILWRGNVIGRLDPKAHRKEGIFEIKSFHLEPGVEITPEIVSDVASAIIECACWHETPKVQITSSNPPKLAKMLMEEIRRR